MMGTPDAELQRLIDHQRRDDARDYEPREPGTSRFSELGREGPAFDLPDPGANTVASAIARDELARWDGRGFLPERPAIVGSSSPGWCLMTEAAAALGQSCPGCGDTLDGRAICLACLRSSPQVEAMIARAPELYGTAVETVGDARAADDAAYRRETGGRGADVLEALVAASYAERRWGKRAAKLPARKRGRPVKVRTEPAPTPRPKAAPRRPAELVAIVSANGRTRKTVPPHLVGAYVAVGYRLEGEGQGGRVAG